MKKIAFVDLDGTLIKNNSFHIWLKVLVWSSLKRGNFINFFKIQFIVILRLLKIYSRKKMKSSLLKLSINSKYADEIKDEIASRCIPFFRITLINRLIELNFDYIFIVSAAPSFYLDSIIKKMDLSVNQIIGSTFENGFYYECAGENKKVMIDKLKNKFNEDCKFCLYTDHYEDLPSAMIIDEVFLVEPNELSINRFNQHDVKYNIFNE